MSLILPAEVAEMLGVSVRSVQRLARCGDIAHIRVGRAMRFTAEQVQEYLARQTRAVAPREWRGSCAGQLSIEDSP